MGEKIDVERDESGRFKKPERKETKIIGSQGSRKTTVLSPRDKRVVKK